MKRLIIFIEVYAPGGHEKALMDIATNLPKQSIVLLFNQGNPRLSKFAVENNITHQVLKLKRNYEVVSFELGFHAIFSNIMWHIKRILNGIINYRYLTLLFRHYTSEDNLFILTAYPGTDSCRIAAILGKKAGIKNVCFSILNNPSPYPVIKGTSLLTHLLQIPSSIYIWINRWIDFKINHAVDTFVVNSKLAGKSLHDFIQFPRTKIKVVYTGIQVPEPKQIEKVDKISNDFLSLTKKPGEIWFGMIGNLMQIKGQQYLIESVKIAMERVQPSAIKCLIVGGGPDYEILLQLKHELGLDNNVFLTNLYPYAISDIFRFLDVFVFASLSESLPYTISEAMAFKLPIISTNVGGIPEQIDNGINGFLVEKANAQQLAQKMIWMIDNRDKWEELGRNAYLKVKTTFSIEKMVKDFNELFGLYS